MTVCQTHHHFCTVPCIYAVYPLLEFYIGDEMLQHELRSSRYIFRKNFSNVSHIDYVRDHFHLSKQFIFTLLSKCNLTHAK